MTWSFRRFKTPLTASKMNWSCLRTAFPRSRSSPAYWIIWRCPKIGVPLNHPFIDGFSILNSYWVTPIVGNFRPLGSATPKIPPTAGPVLLFDFEGQVWKSQSRAGHLAVMGGKTHGKKTAEVIRLIHQDGIICLIYSNMIQRYYANYHYNRTNFSKTRSYHGDLYTQLGDGWSRTPTHVWELRMGTLWVAGFMSFRNNMHMKSYAIMHAIYSLSISILLT